MWKKSHSRKNGKIRIVRLAEIKTQNRNITVFEDIFRKTEKLPFLRLPHAKYYYHNNFLAAMLRRKRKLISNNSARDERRKDTDMEESKKKICPFNSTPCIEGECALFDDEIAQCEFRNLSRFIWECMNDLIKSIEEKKS